MGWQAAIAGLSGGLGIATDYLSDERQRRDNDTYYRMSREDQERDRALQKEFAQNGVKWRMEDAERAGVHPLYALGASGATYSPTISTFTPQPVRSSAGDSIRQMGQDVSRATAATHTQSEREREALIIQGLKLDNEHKALMIRQQSQVGPSMPNFSGVADGLLSGQGNSLRTGSGFVQMSPQMRGFSSRYNRGVAIGEIPDIQYVRGADGNLYSVPSNEVTQPIEDKIVEEAMHAYRNHIANFFTGHKPPSPTENKLPRGALSWKWDWRKHGYVPYYGRDINTLKLLNRRVD